MELVKYKNINALLFNIFRVCLLHRKIVKKNLLEKGFSVEIFFIFFSI